MRHNVRIRIKKFFISVVRSLITIEPRNKMLGPQKITSFSFSFFLTNLFYVPVPYRNFVTSVNQNYSPQFFATTEELNILLQKNFLINQSNTEISDEAIEVLCLGLNFIPSKKLVKGKIDKPLNKLISDINKHIVLYKRKETGNKGWLSKLVKSE